MGMLRSSDWYAGNDPGYPGMPEVANLPLPRKMLELGVRGLLQLEVAEQELVRRNPAPTVTGAFASPKRGWERLYVDHVQQPDTGADLDFLVGASGPVVARESH